MKGLKFKSSETIFAGDAKNDVLMAQNTHVTPVAVLTGHLDKRQAEELGVKYIMKDITQIVKILNK